MGQTSPCVLTVRMPMSYAVVSTGLASWQSIKLSLLLFSAPPNATLPSECENGDVQIVGGTVTNEGRVELCFHGHWGTICSDTWNNADAGVVCKQLGYASSG